MQCPSCRVYGAASVIESRPQRDGTVRRRRVCGACGERYSTLEVAEGEAVRTAERIVTRARTWTWRRSLYRGIKRRAA